jgi:hypothetical protein
LQGFARCQHHANQYIHPDESSLLLKYVQTAKNSNDTKTLGKKKSLPFLPFPARARPAGKEAKNGQCHEFIYK